MAGGLFINTATQYILKANSLSKRVFTHEISFQDASRDEIIPVYGEMSLTVYTFLPK